MKLILPISGKSSRFPGMRPKWMLTMPNGQLMIERSIEGLNLDEIDTIIIIALRNHFDELDFSPDYLIELIKSKANYKANHIISVDLKILDNATNSQPTTIFRYLSTQEGDFPFFIKDSDNYFEYKPKAGNNVTYVPLSELDLVAAGTKSYIQSNRFNEVEQIAEKSIISSDFCCGGYGFLSSKEFLNTYKELDGENNSSLYISHIIHKQLLDGNVFYAEQAYSYEDYGTANEFFSYTKNSSTIFCDFDGVLVKNSSKFSKKPWSYEPLKSNLEHLSNYLKNSTSSELVITTSRPLEELEKIKLFLESFDIFPHTIITNLPHSKRILINDFSATNPFPSAQAINLPRDSSILSDYI